MSIDVVSFDMSKTWMDDEFFQKKIWFERIPELYAMERGWSDTKKATEEVMNRYYEFGPDTREWSDLQFWIDELELPETITPKNLLQGAKTYLKPFSEVYSVLQGLRDYPLIIITEAPRVILDFELNEFMEHFEETFSTVDDLGTVIKTPEAYEIVCEKLGIKPWQMAHFGDEVEKDYYAPIRAGVNAFLLDRNDNYRGLIPEWRVIHDLTEAIKRVREFESFEFRGSCNLESFKRE